MSYTSPKLYGYDSKGGIKVWWVTTEEDTMTVHHGSLEGKITTKSTKAKGKNVGRSNETTGAIQAISEATSRWNKKWDQDYRKSVEDIPKSVLPMLAHKYQDKAKSVKYPCDILLKLDGVRGTAYYKDGKQILQSRGGKEYPIIQEIADELDEIFFNDNPNLVVDGELYCHGMYLEDITAAVKKHNEDTPKIEFHVFDVIDPTLPIGEPWCSRYLHYQQPIENSRKGRVVAVEAHQCLSEGFMKGFHLAAVHKKYEGIVLRNYGDKYTFGQRTTGIIKYKVAASCEFLCVSMQLDKNGGGTPVVKVLVKKGTPMNRKGDIYQEDTWEEFAPTFASTHEKRIDLWENQDNYIGRYLTVDFEKYSKYGIPTKPIGKAFRELDSNGNPME